jgi:hypothetical protein
MKTCLKSGVNGAEFENQRERNTKLAASTVPPPFHVAALCSWLIEAVFRVIQNGGKEHGTNGSSKRIAPSGS